MGRRVDRVRRASFPELAGLLGKRSALVVAGPSSRRTQRQIHRMGAEHVLGAVAVQVAGGDQQCTAASAARSSAAASGGQSVTHRG